MAKLNSTITLGLVRVEGRGIESCQALNDVETLDAELLPLMKVVFPPIPVSQRQCLLNLDHYQQVIVTSAAAATAAIEELESIWPQWPVQQTWWAIGDATREALEDAMIYSKCPKVQTSEGLVAQIEPAKDDRILILKGSGGRSVLQDHLSQIVDKVDTVNLYQREGLSPSSIDPWLAKDILFIASGELVEILYSLAERDKLTEELTEKPILVPSDRVKQLAEDIGFTRVVSTNGMANGQILSALDRIGTI